MKFQNFNIENVLEQMLNFGIRVEMKSDIVKQLRSNKRQIYKWRRLNSFPLDFVFSEYKNLLNDITYIKSGNGNGHSVIRIPTKFDRNLAYILGAFRDGSVYSSRGKHWIRIYDLGDAQWIKNIKPIIEGIFEINLHLRYQKNFDASYLDISSKPLFHFLKIISSGSVHKNVPEIIKTAPLEFKKSYVEGFFDAEGHVPHSQHKYQIDFTQKDRSSLEFIKEFLESLDIKCGKISTHRLPIYGKENLKKFYKSFNFLNEKKSYRLKLLLEAP